MRWSTRLALVLLALAVLPEIAALHGHTPAGGAPALRASAPAAGAEAAQPNGGCGLCRLASELRTRAPVHGAAASRGGAGPSLLLPAQELPLASARRAHPSEAPRAPPTTSLLALS